MFGDEVEDGKRRWMREGFLMAGMVAGISECERLGIAPAYTSRFESVHDAVNVRLELC